MISIDEHSLGPDFAHVIFGTRYANNYVYRVEFNGSLVWEKPFILGRDNWYPTYYDIRYFNFGGDIYKGPISSYMSFFTSGSYFYSLPSLTFTSTSLSISGASLEWPPWKTDPSATVSGFDGLIETATTINSHRYPLYLKPVFNNDTLTLTIVYGPTSNFPLTTEACSGSFDSYIYCNGI